MKNATYVTPDYIRNSYDHEKVVKVLDEYNSYPEEVDQAYAVNCNAGLTPSTDDSVVQETIETESLGDTETLEESFANMDNPNCMMYRMDQIHHYHRLESILSLDGDTESELSHVELN